MYLLLQMQLVRHSFRKFYLLNYRQTTLGAVQHWHMTSGKCLHSLEDEGNQVYAMDYNAEGSKFVTAGKDTAVRVYDEATKSLLLTMKGEDEIHLN